MKNFLKKSKVLRKIYNNFNFAYKKRYSSYVIDKSNYFDPSIHYIGLKHIQFGYNNVVSEGTWFNVNKRIDAEIGIEMGHNCYIGKRNFFSSGKEIIIGDFFMSGINCSFLGSDHKFEDPLVPYMFTGTTDCNAIIIGDNVWLGANVTIIGDVTIGHGSIIGANSLVTRTIPPFSLVVGSPARVIKRFDFSNNIWTTDFSELRDFISESEYKEQLAQFKEREISPFPSGKSFGDLFS
ncbi:acyltransferase [Colwellia demingiae]|nr:acyltransferase [Colwellia demingiae]